MPNKKGHRRFGNVRKLPSGRFQARYLGPDGLTRTAPDTFDTKTDAEQWLSGVETDIVRGDWVDPLLAKVKLADFGHRWIKERQLGRRSRETYMSTWRLHIEPYLGRYEIGQVTTQTVRTWRSKRLEDGRGDPTVAKAYRLLRSIFATAKDDELIKRNPCRIKGADKVETPERPFATLEKVYEFADLVPARYRALIVAAAFTGLRWGELVGIRRCDLDLNVPAVRVPRRTAELDDGTMEDGPTKSAAGKRTVALPALVVPELRRHLAQFVASDAEALVFTSPAGARLRRGNFRRTVKWAETLRKAGLPSNFHFHDLRHTGNQLAAEAGASTKELMHRMGHGTVRAALVYQHATSKRDREIAAEMDRRAKAAMGKKPARRVSRRGRGQAKG